MLIPRVIPCLLLKDKGLVKTIKFKNPKYVGDPINAVRIFNEKEVDELIFLDVNATIEKRPPPLDVISQISDECLMPLTFGGGISTVDQVKQVLNAGAEKVSINTSAVENPILIKEASENFGSQSIVVAIDVKKKLFGKYEVFTHDGTISTGLDPFQFSQKMEQFGAGEILINSIDRDGTMLGYDINLIKSVTTAVNIPVIACGGAGKIQDFSEALLAGGASAVAAGSLFVFYGKRRAVLINYPAREELQYFLRQ
jgi:cyclase